METELLNIDQEYWCNSDNGKSCIKHSYNFIYGPPNSDNQIRGKDNIHNCIVCNKNTINYNKILLLHKPKTKYLINNTDKVCYTEAIVNCCINDKCINVINKVNELFISGWDEWDIYDNIIHSITLILKDKL
jgi:hypothetical protein